MRAQGKRGEGLGGRRTKSIFPEGTLPSSPKYLLRIRRQKARERERYQS